MGNNEEKPLVNCNAAADTGGAEAGHGAQPHAPTKPGEGTPPSNTVPGNYIQNDGHIRVLRYGVDSLYLSYPGRLATTWNQRLQGLKLVARAQEERDSASAQVRIKDHLFEVQGKGQGKFAYVLVDNFYHIALASTHAEALPMAYVQLASELITALGVEAAAVELRYIINTLGLVKDEPNVSRVDLFVDFTSDTRMDGWAPGAWVTRAHRIDMHTVNRRFSGWSIGLGGVISARLYDKTLELEKSHKDYLKPLWEAGGWRAGQTVWRMEFELKRAVLKELGILQQGDLLPHLGGLWRYATESWLRLSVPNDDDRNQTRWPNHPLWDALSGVAWDTPQAAALCRVSNERVPSGQALYVNGLGTFTSFMASKRITDLGEGFGEYLAHAERFHAERAKFTGKDFKEYISDKVASKGRKFNTLENKRAEAEEEQRAEAEQYRKAKDGE